MVQARRPVAWPPPPWLGHSSILLGPGARSLLTTLPCSASAHPPTIHRHVLRQVLHKHPTVRIAIADGQPRAARVQQVCDLFIVDLGMAVEGVAQGDDSREIWLAAGVDASPAGCGEGSQSSALGRHPSMRDKPWVAPPHAPALDCVAHAVPLLLCDAVKQLAEDAQREAALQSGAGQQSQGGEAHLRSTALASTTGLACSGSGKRSELGFGQDMGGQLPHLLCKRAIIGT